VVDLSKLNPPQREAAAHGGGPLLVLAGAGSGKTRVITFRIAHLLANGIPPQAICAVTFTNKAAEEMRERVAGLVRDKATSHKLTIGTFHALGLNILRAERKALGMPRGFTVYDQSDQMGALREALRHTKDMSRDGERRFDVKSVCRGSRSRRTRSSPPTSTRAIPPTTTTRSPRRSIRSIRRCCAPARRSTSTI